MKARPFTPLRQKARVPPLLCAAVTIACALTAARAQSVNSDWPYYGNDPGGMRYVNMDQVNRSNVVNLTPAWIFHTGVFNPDTSFEAQPVVVNGVMYITSPHDTYLRSTQRRVG